LCPITANAVNSNFDWRRSLEHGNARRRPTSSPGIIRYVSECVIRYVSEHTFTFFIFMQLAAVMSLIEAFSV
jgi:hypothetical protein